MAIKYNQTTNQGAHKFTMWLFIVSSCMVFAGFTSALLVRRGAGGAWTGVELPSIFNLSTFIIIFSSATIWVAHHANKKGNYILTAFGLLVTLVCGVLFCNFQYQGWLTLVNSGFYPSGNPNPAPQFFFVIVLMHALHISIGMLFLLIATVKSIFLVRRLKSDNVVEVLEQQEKGLLLIRTDLLSMFWHFMGILWIYLFVFLYINLK